MAYTDRDQALNTSDILVEIPTILDRDTDLYLEYNRRLDLMSFDIYGVSTLWWLILCANPEYTYEYEIPRNTTIRIPYPLEAITEIFGAK